MNTINQSCGEMWSLYNGDSAEVLKGIPSESVDLSIYSPPFSSLYTYSNSERDMGNCKSDAEFFAHYSYVTKELRRIVKPGRLLCVHCMDLPTTKATSGVIGLKDFTGGLIAHHVSQGFVYHGRITVDRCPQATAIRNKSHQLMFATLDRDRTALSPVYPEYILLFRVPGDNTVPLRDGSVSREEWIQWARAVWYDVKQTNTLNVQAARSDRDERHICALSLDIIERCVKLWSNAGEVVLSPFAGIGSELYQSVLLGRRTIGVELNPNYFKVACKNLMEAERKASAQTLFSVEDEASSVFT